MSDSELLKVMESVLADAVVDAEFTRLPKDLTYAQTVSEKVEKLRAKIDGREPVAVTLTMEGGRVCVSYRQDSLPGLRKESDEPRS